HHLIKAVHEFGRELAPRRFHGRALYLLVQPSGRLVFWLNETRATLHQLGNLAAAEVGRQKDHRLRQIYFPVVPKGQRGLVQHSQKRSEERRVGKECRSRWSPYQ